MKNKVAVIIPFYKPGLSPYESISLQQCFKTLLAYPVIAIKPRKLQLSAEITAYPFADTVSFDDDYFKDVQGYNRLMLSDIFYGRFLNLEYILIYQLDAFVFKDELEYWCKQGVDYIGAPWIRRKKYSTWIKSFFSSVRQQLSQRYNLKKNGLPNKYQFDDRVGNGGFSLRKIKIFYDICISHQEKIVEYNDQSFYQYNEDIFWSIEVNRKRKTLNIPHYKFALKFSIEFYPERALVINKGQLPFGCHAWDKNADFWRPIFEQYGYII
jgi:hypothetical protein